MDSEIPNMTATSYVVSRFGRWLTKFRHSLNRMIDSQSFDDVTESKQRR